MTPKEIAQRYVALSNAVNYEAMSDLFAEDADWIPIAPIPARRGRKAIRDGYLRQVKSNNKSIINDRYYVDGHTCVVEFDVDLGGGDTAAIVDILTFNEALEITRLAVYRR